MSDPLADVMRGLRREYLRESREREAELQRLLGQAEQGDRGALDELRRTMHRLAGSGGSYGFAAVSTSSRVGEQLARRLLESGAVITPDDVAALQTAVADVARAFAQARAAEGDL